MFVIFQVYKTFINKLDVTCFISTVRKSSVFSSACGSGASGISISELSRRLFLPTASPFCMKGFRL